MNMEQWTVFFMWMSIVNFGLLILSTIMVLVLQKWVFQIHHRLFAITDSQFHVTVYGYLGAYKLLWIVFCLTPYISFRLMG